MEELRIEVLQTPGKIETNFTDIEAALSLQMQAYETLAVTEDTIPERKADVATLRKIRKAIDDRRKDVKKAYNVPLTAFENKVKHLTGIIDNQIDRINSGLSEFEEMRKAEKQKHIEELYAANIGDYAEYLPLKTIQGAKWLNKTCTDNEIIADIQAAVLDTKTDISTIKALGSEIEDDLLDVYRILHSIPAVIKRNADYMHAAQIAAQKAAETPQKATGVEIPTEEPKYAQKPIPCGWWAFAVREEDAQIVKNYLELMGIEYEEG